MSECSKRATGMPGWVKAFVGVGIFLVVAVGVMMALGHGPWQHMSMH